MKIVLLNGSPKGTPSNSYKLSCTFVDGIKAVIEPKEEVVVDVLHVVDLKIGACKGCFNCWKGTPGVCCQKDDMTMVLEKLIAADVIIWCFPLYVYNVPGIMKNLIDRMLPLNYPYMVERFDGYGSGAHPPRHDLKKKKHVLISVCGFYSAEGNYDSVTTLFNHRCGKDNYTTLFCGQGELFRFPELSDRTNVYLGYVKKAGEEFAANGVFSDETKEHLKELILPKKTYEKLADFTWGIEKETQAKVRPDLTFTQIMASLYNPNAYDKDRVLQFHYTDVGSTYQIAITKDSADVLKDCSATPTTTIETPIKLWIAISRKEVDGHQALAEKKYTVTGDISFMMNWSKFFGFALPRN